MLNHRRTLMTAIATLVLGLAHNAEAQLVFENTVVEIEAEPDAKQVTGVYKFTNDGSYAISVRDIRGPRDCRIKSPDQTSFRSGEGGEIEVSYTLGKERGQIEREIRFFTDATRNAATTLLLRIDLSAVPLPEKPKPKPLYRITPRFVMWRTGDEVEPAKIEIEILKDQPLPIADVKLQRFHSLPLRSGQVENKGSSKDKRPDPGFKTEFKVVEPGRKYVLTVTPTELKTHRRAAFGFVDGDGQYIRRMPPIRASVIDIELLKKRQEEAAKAKAVEEENHKPDTTTPENAPAE